MKSSLFNLLAAIILIAGGLAGTSGKAIATQEVSVGVSVHATADFEAPLAAEGGWVSVGTYGRCWRPRGMAVGWRPYCAGDWVWTDCGWYWESDEPWAWACYHYGSWVEDPGMGWVWVPGVEWAPAWVVWRSGGGYIGWAPCAPRGVIVAPGLFAFVEVGHFHDPIRPASVVINNTTIIGKTTQIGDVKRESRNIGGRNQTVVVNEGPGVADVEKATGKKITAASVVDVSRKTRAPENLRPTGRGTDAGKDAAPANRGIVPDRDAPKIEPVKPSEPPKVIKPDVVNPVKPDVVRPPDRRGEPIPQNPGQRQGEPPRGGGGGDRGRDGGGDNQKDKDRGRGGGGGMPSPTPPVSIAPVPG